MANAVNLTGKLVLIGAGKMGTAMLEGWLKAGVTGNQVVIFDPAPPPETQALIASHGITRIAAVGPRAVPRLFGRHGKRERRRAAGRRRRRFGDQSRRNVSRLRVRRTNGQENRGQQGHQRQPDACHKSLTRQFHAPSAIVRLSKACHIGGFGREHSPR